MIIREFIHVIHVGANMLHWAFKVLSILDSKFVTNAKINSKLTNFGEIMMHFNTFHEEDCG